MAEEKFTYKVCDKNETFTVALFKSLSAAADYAKWRNRSLGRVRGPWYVKEIKET